MYIQLIIQNAGEIIIMQLHKSLKINTLLNAIKTFTSILFPMITFPYISRVLLPENVGKINFASSFVSYFSLIASLGISTYAIRECAAIRDDKRALSKSASEIYSINVCTTLVAYILLACSLIFMRRLDSYREIIILQALGIALTTLGADWINSAMEDFQYITIRYLFFQFVSLILMFIFVKESSDYVKYVVISLVATSGANLANVVYRKKYCKIKFTLQMRWKKHFSPILLLFVMLFAQTIFNSADMTMLGFFKDDYAVGIYSTAFKIKNIICQIVSSLTWVVMPRMSFYFAEGDPDKIRNMLKKILSTMVTIGFPCIAGCCILAKEIVQVIGGEEYSSAAFPLIILMISYLFDIFGGGFLGNMICLPSKKEKIFMEACCVAAVINVVLNYFLIPIGGVDAAAFTTVISDLTMLIWLLIKKDKEIKLDYIWEVVKTPLIGVFAIIIYCFIIRDCIQGIYSMILFSVVGSVILYIGLLVLLKNTIVCDVMTSIKKFLFK